MAKIKIRVLCFYKCFVVGFITFVVLVDVDFV